MCERFLGIDHIVSRFQHIAADQNRVKEVAAIGQIGAGVHLFSSQAKIQFYQKAIHVNAQYANNRVEQSHQRTRVCERGMQTFKSVLQAQRFLDAHAEVYNLFNIGRHLVSATQYRDLRTNAFEEWSLAVT